MQTAAVLAIDGGGTSCRALLCDAAGSVLGYAQEGPVNYHSTDTHTVRATLGRLLRLLPDRPAAVGAAVFGFAGLDTDRDWDVLSVLADTVLRDAGIRAGTLLVENDGMLTLLGTAGAADGLLLIAGTGSIACGITRDGRRARVGGWGSRVGDEGSGYAIGISALRHVLRAADGREKPSGISTAILQEKGMADVEQLINWLYSPAFSVQAVAALAPVIFALAERGDWQAERIIRQALEELTLMAATVINTLALSNTGLQVILAGGVLQNNPCLREQLAQSVQRLAPHAQFVPAAPPVIGGALWGLRAAGIENPAVLQRIRATNL